MDSPTLERKQLTFPTAQQAFQTSSNSFLLQARKEFGIQPFRMMTDYGDAVILPTEFAGEIRNHPKLSFTGFEWHDIPLRPAMLDVVARMSSRVFVGEELCRDEHWLRITKEYTVNLFLAFTEITAWPPRLRRFVAPWIPRCRALRQQYEAAAQVLAPVLQARRAGQSELEEGKARREKKQQHYNDALEWAGQVATRRGAADYDVNKFQLTLSVAAIHTSTDLLVQTLIDLAQHPAFVPRLRAEIAAVLRKHGWTKLALYHMKLLDSCIKESQRLKPIGVGESDTDYSHEALMRRIVEEDFRLSNGLLLKKGNRIHIDTQRMRDPAIYPDPDEWDGARFAKLRAQPAPGRWESASLLVSTSVDHLGFGHGEHACPGRFFAANEVKVALCHLLMKYDLALVPGTDVRPVASGWATTCSVSVRMAMRRRPREHVELDIDDLAAGGGGGGGGGDADADLAT
ncbi:hypothetical protein SLS62_007811 [Diatrype stigma]|uniref:Uncharacterized protein n=1 Tax=Diatrype stigma TaxID=117547 RepID=A0AAN9UKY7_9PEZI